MSLSAAATPERLEIAAEFVDHQVAALVAGSKLTATEWDDRLAKAAGLVAGPDGIARGVVINWLDQSTRSEGVSALANFDAASVLGPAGIDVGTIRELVGFLLTIWDLIRSRSGN